MCPHSFSADDTNAALKISNEITALRAGMIPTGSGLTLGYVEKYISGHLKWTNGREIT